MAQNQGMGGIGISNGNPWYINTMNPALLTYNHVTAFQGGMQLEKKTLTDGANSQSFQNGNLDYLVVAFPVKTNRWTTSIGLVPYSNVNYNLSYQEYANGTYQLITYQETGRGGLNQFYWANGVKVNKYVSLGAKASYLFGTNVIKDNSFNPLATANAALSTQDSFHGLNFTGGAQLHFDSLFGTKYVLNFGAVGSLGSNVAAQHITQIQSVTTTGRIADSLTLSNQYGKLHLPFNYGFGVSFGRTDHWTLGWDFTYLDYTKFDYRTNDDVRRFLGTPTVGYRTGIGFEYLPQADDFTNYLRRITYRLGASYEQSPILVNSNYLTDKGASFGFSFPVNNISTIDLGVKVGRRGVLSQNLLEENYFRVYFGITFNDRLWFIKRKFD
ncbi:MAG TPA: hypothetical protein VL728_08045 [Cyclobacteriaceae bacterium]|nr:hypothetical protein [Cyclobacteriaceae bacterium]